ncbi:MAG TPA: hypothetical protein VFA55_05665 [Candidatus Kapabacteria bacterium]|nr:hypothetical protein [Candidatus Kapabacteria bacterium]
MGEECSMRDESNLAILPVSDSQENAIRWHGNDEFEYQGRLYDISYSLRQSDTTYYYCVNDTKEETLIAGVNEHVKNHTGDADNQNRESKIALKNVTQDYYYNNAELLSAQEEEARFIFEINLSCSFLHPDVPTPPPKA